ncbi:MAG: GNAT family N-acetyltransferase [Chloroflexi bacterium]|nr:GNAT family N-acetyltransferase [Chloroflexota bacterium]
MLETERLVLRKFEFSDHHALNQLLGDDEVMESSMEGVMDSKEILHWLGERMEEYKNNNDVNVFGVVDKSSTELIGYCGLFHFSEIDGRPEIEIGYRLIRKVWGCGFATEAAMAVRNYAFSDLQLKRLIALIEPKNKRSIRVAEKLGMSFEKVVMLEDYDYPDHLYSMQLLEGNA